MTPLEFKEIRKQMKMTQKQMANFLCKYVRTIQRYEEGKYKIPPLVKKILTHPSFNQYIDENTTEKQTC